jgi:uncharacterized membrane protein YdjX (TVP38/TMEM64 family)
LVVTNKHKWDWRAYLAVAILVVTTLTMIVPVIWGTEILGVEGEAGVAQFLSRFKNSPYAAFVVLGVFTLLGMTGFPQFLLIGGTAAIFGPWLGFFYSWLATMVSCTLGFYIGRFSGGTMLRRYAGPKLQSTSRLLGRRGIFASFIVRLIPSGPAVVVNMLAGVSHIRVWKFLVGTGLGILPKTVAIAFFGGSILAALRSRNLLEIGGVGAILVVWILAGIWVRRRYFNRKDATGDENDNKNDDDHGPGAGPPGSGPVH